MADELEATVQINMALAARVAELTDELAASNARVRQLAADNNHLRRHYDDLDDRGREEAHRLQAERAALHHALNNLMALVRTDYCDYNAWDAGVVALIPGYREGLGVTVAFAYEVERAEKRLAEEPSPHLMQPVGRHLTGCMGGHPLYRCRRCGCPVMAHATDDEERRECMSCECEQYEMCPGCAKDQEHPPGAGR
jgi:hypothetical protein